jgi:hypothetical protein
MSHTRIAIFSLALGLTFAAGALTTAGGQSTAVRNDPPSVPNR